MRIFKKPEARMMMSSFANMESIHQHAYSLLLDTVGMPEIEYKAFAENEEMSNKHDYVNSFKPTLKNKKAIAKTLAVYSAFTEGLQLFSSFAILLNFPRFGKMKGMGQIVTYSIRDESLHVEAMTKLFREFIKENVDIWTDEFKKEIYDICREMVKLEDKFLDLVFEYPLCIFPEVWTSVPAELASVFENAVLVRSMAIKLASSGWSEQ